MSKDPEQVARENMLQKLAALEDTLLQLPEPQPGDPITGEEREDIKKDIASLRALAEAVRKQKGEMK